MLFRISALEICLGVTMGSRDADPTLLCSIKGFLHRLSGFPACDGSGGTLKRSAACANLERPFFEQILTPTELFGFAKSEITGVTTFFVNSQSINPLNANFTKWSNTLKQFVGNLPTNCLSKFDQFVGLVLKVLRLPKIQIVDDFKYLGAYIANCHTDFKRLA